MHPESEKQSAGSSLKDLPQTGEGVFSRWYNSEPGENRRGVPYNEQSNGDDEEVYILELMRPISIAVIVWLHIISLVLLAGVLVFASRNVPRLPGWFWLPSLVDFALLVTMLVGLWNMRKYAAWLFIIHLAFASLVALLAENSGAAFSTSIFTVIMTAFIFKSYHLMR